MLEMICVNCLIGRDTWNASLDAAKQKHVLKPAQRDAARDYFAGFGAWSEQEIARWTATELDAMVLQEAAGNLRELQSLAPGDGLGEIDWTKAEKLMARGTVSSRLFVSRNRLYVSLFE